MSGMNVQAGAAMGAFTAAAAASVDRDRAAADPVHAARVGYEVLALDQDLPVLADRDRAVAAAEREGLLRFEHELVGAFHRLRAVPADASEDHAPLASFRGAPDQHRIARRERRRGSGER